MKLLFFDFEVFKYDWLVCIGDVSGKQMHVIINNRDELEGFYRKHKDYVWVGFNSRHYDQYIMKGILAGLDPYYISDQIINKGVQGWQISKMLNDWFFYHYDCKPGLFSLKKHEAFMGSDIKESSVSFDIDRKLTESEIADVVEYCKHDVRETFKLFQEIEKQRSTFESHILMIKEFKLKPSDINKTPTRLTANLLGAVSTKRDDEFDLVFPKNLNINKHNDIISFFKNWAGNIRDYNKIKLNKQISGVEHNFGVGGLHGAIPNFVKEGLFLMIDVASYYPALMIEYGLLSRNCKFPEKYKGFRDERIMLKKKGDVYSKNLSNIRKIPLNGTYGATKDKNNPLYDPRQANNICILGQCFLVDLIEKLESCCKLIQSNTDGILVQVFNKDDVEKIKLICDEWSKRTLFELEIDEFTKIIQRDVNNYIAYNSNTGVVKQKGSYKKRTPLDNNLAIVNEAIVKYYTENKPLEETIYSETDLIKFQMVTSIGGSYKYMIHNGGVLKERTIRVFASSNKNDTSVFKRRNDAIGKYKIEKMSGVPERAFIDNGNIVGKKVDDRLDKSWYVLYARYQIALIEGQCCGLKVKDYVNLLTPDYEKGTGSLAPRSKSYNPNKERDIFINMVGKEIELP